ncbi:cytochrome c oxidase subunit 2A [Gorillibacterium sp. sgz5001074]|uniref:cytochrome c oxidase subunit 2A n=1 Tax=Gorillibacterium sp. sgz5001074 TaxID=3446695 RepID=UPI003F6724E0
MADSIRKAEPKELKNGNDKHEEESLKGTFVAVLLLGGFLALTWLAVFVLFIARS